MIWFVVFSLLLFLFYCVFEIIGLGKFQSYAFMSRNHTNILRAIAILMVVWGHVGAKLGVNNLQFIGGIGVALFLISSGYGLFISYQKNESIYGSGNGLRNYWKKKILKVILPFWIVETVGLLMINKFDISILTKDLLFIQPATSYGWYMQYLIICYVLFWLVLKIKENTKLNPHYTIYLLFGCFTVWFVIESMFFANPNIPFLKARQMFSFPLGVLMSYYSKQLSSIYAYKKNVYRQILYTFLGIFVGGSIIVLTQLSTIKSLPYLASNTIALLSVLPMAVAMIFLTNIFQRLFNNKFLYVIGIVSYEIYLVHAFSLIIINKSLLNVMMFIVTTMGLVVAIFLSQRAINDKILIIADSRR